MNQFLLAHSAGKDTDSLLSDCLEQLNPVPTDASFGFLYISDHLTDYADLILQQLKQHCAVSHWVGSSGIGLLASHTEYYNQPAMVIMLADFNEADFYILPNICENTRPLEGEVLDWCNKNDFNVGLIHADPDNPAIQPLIHQLGQDIPASFLLGGVSSSRSQNIQFADHCLQNGISGVLFSPQIPVLSNLTQGCTPIGPRHRVTHSERNIVYNLDNRPALDVLTDDVGETISRDWLQASNYIFAGLVNKNSDIEDYTIRPLMGVDTENKLLIIADYLHNDQDIMFCRRDSLSSIEDMRRMLLQLKSRLSSTIRGGIYISCMGRGREQFGADSEEVALIHSVLGDFPLAGFFANGEIHKSLLYGFTGVLTLFV